MSIEPHSRQKATMLFLFAALTLASARLAVAQTPPVPEPSTPPPSAPAGAAPAGAAPARTTRESELEGRVRQLELMIQQMSNQRAPGGGGLAAGAGSVNEPGAGAGNGATVAGSAPGNAGAAGGSGGPAGGSTGGGSPISTDLGGASNSVPAGAGPGGNTPTGAPSAKGGALAPGQGSPPNPAPSDRFNMPPTTINSPLTGRFGPGFELKTADDEFVIQFHNLTQIDGRFHEQGGQNPVHDTFAIPRQWWMLSGRITKPYEYFLSFQQGFDVLNLLDVFLNVHYDDRLQFKFGRFKTPFTYEFYTEPIQGLISPERSLFFNNFALNRSVGFMGWGRLFNTTVPLDYAVGLFNNARNSYVDTSDQKNILAYVNWRPFALLEDSPLENFVFGGSVQAGTQTNNPLPATLRTVVATSGNSVNGVPFLTFNNNVRESGPRAFWDLHAAWYYRHLSLIAEWQSGYQDYALATSLAAHDRVGIQSYYVQAGYFITGETVAGRNVVKPLRNFDIRKGRFGPGAIELQTRYNPLDLSRNIFSAGLVDPNLWTNNLYTVDTGFNWYLTQYSKVSFTWNHAVFGNPVLYNATASQKTSDLFLIRFQLYF